MRKNLLIALTLLFSLQLNAQLKAKLAAKHYQNLAYVQAAPMYDELADKFLTKKQGDKSYILRAAISNAKIYKYDKSVAYFKQLMALDVKGIGAKDYMTYIDELRILKRYKESQTVAQNASTIYPNNSYFKLIAKDGNNLKAIEARGKYNSVKVMPFNSDLGDFAPVEYQDSIIFATRSVHKGFLVGRYAWDGENFTKLVYTYQKDGKWKSPKALGGVFTSRKHDGPVAFSPDGKTMVLTRDLGNKEVNEKGTLHHLALYISKKQANGKWGELKKFLYSPKTSNNAHACFSSDGNRIYFVSDRTGSIGGTDIYYSDFKNGSWQEPVNFKKVNTEGDEMFPAVDKNGRLFFASDGYVGLGGLDVYFVNIKGEGKPVNMGSGINTSADDFGLIVDKSSNFKGYFSSNRKGFVDRIYSWESKVPKLNLKVNVLANFATPKPVANQKVQLIDMQSGDTTTLTTGEDGTVSAKLENGKDYKLLTEKEDFALVAPVGFSTNGIMQDTTMNYTLNLDPLLAHAKIHVINKDTKASLENASVVIYDANTKKDTTIQTDANGYATAEVNRNSAFKVNADKKGYIGNEAVFTTNKTEDEVAVEIPLAKIKKGLKFKVENIYYDFNKATLRPESKVSLDKLAKFIKDNNIKVELGSHSDSRGSASYNKRLSQRRAQSCVNYLVKEKNVPRSMIIAKGYGEGDPATIDYNGKKVRLTDGFIYKNHSKDEQETFHQDNRRTEVKILEVRK